MTTAEPATEPTTDAFAEAISGYGMAFLCEQAEGCENEVEWYGNQHQCVQAYMCDEHMTIFIRNIIWELTHCGFVRCRKCQKKFNTLDTFITTRPV